MPALDAGGLESGSLRVSTRSSRRDRAALSCGSHGWAQHLLLILLAAGAAACEPAPGDGTVELRAAQRLTVAVPQKGERPPGAVAFATATSVQLPDRWPIALRTRASGAWYRAVVDLPEAPREPWAIYLPHVSMNAAAWVDGERVGSGGRMTPAPARNWNRPLLFVVPVGVLHAGPNVLDVQLGVQPTYPGLLGALFVGPERALRPAWEWRQLWQVTGVQLTVLLTAYWGLAGLLLWRLRGEPPGIGASALGCVLWSVAMLDSIVRVPPVPPLVWQWVMLSALASSLAAFAVGARRFLGFADPGPDRVVWGIWAAGALAFAAALASGAPRGVEWVVVLWAVASFGVGVYLTALLVLIRRRSAAVEGLAVRYLAPLAALALVFVVHDVAMVSGRDVPPSVLLIPYIGGIIGLWGGVRVIERLSTALAQSDALNRNLEHRVDERGAEIRRGYEHIRTLERAQLLQRERERMMRDVHDGMGSQLISTLALVESKRVAPEEIADALRDALDDMRLLIAPLGPTADDLLTLLATWRARIERRLERRGLAFDWQVADLPPLMWLGPREALNVLRIVQEAVTNVVKHAAATTILVRTALAPGSAGEAGVVVEIVDDGTGAPTDARHVGHGLGNMAARATELGGTIEVHRAARGTRVTLWLPVARGATPEGA